MAEELGLPESTFDSLKDAKTKGEQAKRLLRRMKSVGIDTASRETDLSEKLNTVTKYRDAFFPGKEL